MSPIFTSKSSPGETSNQRSLPQESFQCTPSICNLSLSATENTRSLEGTHALIQGAISLKMYWYTNVRYVEKWKKGNLGTVRYLATVSGVFDVKLPEHPPAEFLGSKMFTQKHQGICALLVALKRVWPLKFVAALTALLLILVNFSPVSYLSYISLNFPNWKTR